jgi:cell division protease FtsH
MITIEEPTAALDISSYGAIGIGSGSRTVEQTLVPPSVNAAILNLARKAAGLTGADIEQAVRIARRTARRERRALTIHDVEAALVGDRPQLGPTLRRRFAVHEAGHAVVAQALNLGEVVSVSINGIEGGTTVIRRNLDRDQDEAYFVDELTFTMAGRAAEAELLGSIGAGSGALRESDLDRAARLAAALEGSMGYGSRLPLLFYGEDALRVRLLQDQDFAERVHNRIAVAEEAARTMVKQRKPEVAALAEGLATDGTIKK